MTAGSSRVNSREVSTSCATVNGSLNEPPRSTIQAVSSALPGWYSCRYAAGTCGCAFMTMPGSASRTPACQDPDLSTLPPGRYAAVSSPRYHTLPCLSCAYQSVVFSSNRPLCFATSVTVTAGMPSITLIRDVTWTRSTCDLPSL